jgi:rhodanese-related sulfurtransferase
MTEEGSEQQQVSVAEARRLIAAGEARVIDLRDAEQRRSGYIPGSVRVGDREELESRLEDVPEDQKIVLVGAGGDRDAEVLESLRGRGNEVVSIEGGMEAWEDERLPIQPSEDPDPPKSPGETPAAEEEPEARETPQQA